MMVVKNKKELAVCTGFIFAILVMRLWNISELDAPFVFGDEVGYWSHAANLAGLSWTEIEPAWYSYGYSLLLVPLFWITHRMPYLYRMAIVINALMGICYFVLGKCIIQKIDENCGNMTAMMISFTASSYSAYVFQANIAWSETFIYTWFLFMNWMMLRFCKHPTWKRTILLSAGMGFLYMIHNRCIVVLVAYLLTLLYMAKKKEIDSRKLFAVIVVFAAIFFINDLIKVYISKLMWNVGDGFSGNDFASQSNRLEMFFDLQGWKILLQSFAGKLWYLFSSTLMLAYMGIAYLIKKIIVCVQEAKKATFNHIAFFYIFLFLSVCGSIALTSIAMIPGEVSKAESVRLDIFFYGRYSDAISGMLIILGLLNFIHSLRKGNILEPVIGLATYLFCSFILYQQIAEIDQFFINTVCAPGIYFYKSFSFDKIVRLVLGVYIAVSVIGVLIQMFAKKKNMYAKIIYCCVIVWLFTNASIYAYQSSIKVHQNAHSSSKEICMVLNENVDYPIYNIVENQYYKREVRTRVIESEMKYKMPAVSELENCFIIVEGERIKSFAKELYFFASNGNICLLGVGDKLAEDVRKKGFACERLWQPEYVSYEMCDITLSVESGIKDIEVTQGECLSVNVALQSKKRGILNNDREYKLAYHIYKENGEEILRDGKRYDYGLFVNKEVIQVNIGADEFRGLGNYIVEFDLVEEGVAWMSDLQGKTAKIQVSVIDDSIRYSYDMELEDFAKTGFHQKEDGFAWTSGEMAEIRCFLEKQDYEVQLMQAAGIPLGQLKIDHYPIEVYLNDQYLTTLIIDHENNGKELHFDVPKEKVNQGKNVFAFKSKLWCPQEFGAKDERKLGFAFRKMIFENNR